MSLILFFYQENGKTKSLLFSPQFSEHYSVVTIKAISRINVYQRLFKTQFSQ